VALAFGFAKTLISVALFSGGIRFALRLPDPGVLG